MDFVHGTERLLFAAVHTLKRVLSIVIRYTCRHALCLRKRPKTSAKSGRTYVSSKNFETLFRIAEESETMAAFPYSMHFVLQEQAVLGSTLPNILMTIVNLQS